jgi:hypothetical protein
MKNTIKNLHQAAQYLAAAGISFIKAKDDDSHTNIGWNKTKSRMETHVFEHVFQLSLNLETQSLEWIKNGAILSTTNINKATHKQIITWISEQVNQHGLSKEYVYSFHYDLPYDKITNEYLYSFDQEEIKSISSEFTKAQNTFEQFLKLERLESPIRVWPHHFDLGIYTKLESENTFMGAGLAIPDSLVDDFYFYASGYNNGEAIETKKFGKMKFGQFRSDWNGATLASSTTGKEQAIEFLKEAKLKYQ